VDYICYKNLTSESHSLSHLKMQPQLSAIVAATYIGVGPPRYLHANTLLQKAACFHFLAPEKVRLVLGFLAF
jgi:hypothetical protein